MDTYRLKVLRGPNVWTNRPCIEAWVDLGPLFDSPSSSFPGFNDRIMSWLPGMIEHRCSEGERGGFFYRLRRGTYLAHILEHTTLELQEMAGSPVGFGRARDSDEGERRYRVAFSYEDETLALESFHTARRLVYAAIYDLPFDIAAEVARLVEIGNERLIGPSTRAIVNAATSRTIPIRRLNDGNLIQLGHGVKQRRIWTAESDATSAIGESIAQDKELTKSMLRAAGVPVPGGRRVETADDAVAAARDLGGNVCVKPIDGNHGRGVHIGLSTDEQVHQAFEIAAKEGSGVMVEESIPGSEHRILVINSRVVAAMRGNAACVVGDGIHIIRELIELQINTDPRRGDRYTCPLNFVRVDAAVTTELANQGFTPDDKPDLGVRILIRRNDTLDVDVTDEVHPSTQQHAIMAAKVVGLDIAGLDLVVDDISIPLDQQGGRFVEVNAGPGLLPHIKPAQGKPRPVGEAIVDMLFSGSETGRIPLVAVSGTNGKTTTSRLMAHILRESGKYVGLACSDGVFAEGRVLESGDCAGPRSARNILINPMMEAGVFEVGRGGVLREGLGFDHCEVAIVTNIGQADHLGFQGIHSPEDMFRVKRCVVDVVLPSGTAVLNATEPLVADMARLSPGSVTYFSIEPDNSLVQTHLLQGKRAVVLKNGWIVASDGANETPVCAIDTVPCTHGGKVRFQIENVLAATAGAWGLGIPLNAVRQSLQSFPANLLADPTRFNVFESAGKTLIVVRCRNYSALAAVAEAIKSFPHDTSRIVYSSESDRRDQDIVRQGELLGKSFDELFLCEISGDKQRPAGEVISLLKQGATQTNENRPIREISDWSTAVEEAWRTLEERGLLVIQAIDVATTVKKVQSLTGVSELAASA